jgi:hypothetical protein
LAHRTHADLLAVHSWQSLRMSAARGTQVGATALGPGVGASVCVADGTAVGDGVLIVAVGWLVAAGAPVVEAVAVRGESVVGPIVVDCWGAVVSGAGVGLGVGAPGVGTPGDGDAVAAVGATVGAGMHRALEQRLAGSQQA